MTKETKVIYGIMLAIATGIAYLLSIVGVVFSSIILVALIAKVLFSMDKLKEVVSKAIVFEGIALYVLTLLSVTYLISNSDIFLVTVIYSVIILAIVMRIYLSLKNNKMFDIAPGVKFGDLSK